MEGGAKLKLIEMDKNGHPYAVLRPPVTPKSMVTNLCAALSTAYEPKRYPDVIDDETGEILQRGRYCPGEEQFEGLSKAEVGAIKMANGYADGDIDATKFVHDRIIGKPKQQIESIQVAVGINDYLKALAEQEKSEIAITVMASHEDYVEVKDNKYSALDGI